MTYKLHAVPKPERKPKKPKQAFGKGQRAQRSGGHLFAKLVSTGRRSWIRQQRCVATGVKTGEWVRAQSWMPATLKALCPYKAQIVVAHIRSRGAFGADKANVVPLERMVHDWQGQIGIKAFEQKIGAMPLREIAWEFEKRYVARQAAIAKRMAAAGERTL